MSKRKHAFALSAAGLSLAGAHAQATTIYFDSFTQPDATEILGLAPETNNGVAGATFHESDNFWTANSDVGVFNNRAQLGADNQASLPIASDGGFVQPEIIRVSAVLNLGNTAGPSTPDNLATQRGVGLGFNQATGGIATNTGFRGVMIGTDGRLILAEEGANESPRAGFLAEIATGIDTASDHSLSYDINTTTGDISNILLDGVLQTDVNTTIFNADINHVGFMVSSAAGGTLATYDDFTVTAVPEPTSLALLGLGGLLIARRRRG